MQSLHKLLRSHYIGAIATGYLLARGVEALIGAFMPALNAVISKAVVGSTAPGLEKALQASFVSNTLLAAVYFATAYLLGTWVYRERDRQPQELEAPA